MHSDLRRDEARQREPPLGRPGAALEGAIDSAIAQGKSNCRIILATPSPYYHSSTTRPQPK